VLASTYHITRWDGDALAQLASATTEEEVLQAFTCILVCQRKRRDWYRDRDRHEERLREPVSHTKIVLGRLQL
jgi:hypothetical protein